MTHGSAPVGIGLRHAHWAELLETRPALGFVEVHAENFFGEGGAALRVLDQVRAEYPLSLHAVGLGLGSAAGVDPWHLDQLARLVARTEPRWVSDHACFTHGAVPPHPAVHAADLLPLPFNAQALDVLCANVQRVQERLQRPLLVENLSAYLRWAGDDCSEPEFLAQLARRTGCQLLLDVNNLYVNARNEQADPSAAQAQVRAWLAALPQGLVGEIHLAGHNDQGTLVIDDHGSPVCEPVWQLYAEALARFGPIPTLIEWDHELPPLPVLLDQARQARERMA